MVGTVGPITAEELHHLGPPYDASSVVGQTGLEQAYERRLAGTPTTRVVVLNSAGATTATLKSFPGTRAGRSQTSIDPTVQRAAEAALAGETSQRGAGRDPRLHRPDPRGRQRPDQLRI